MRFVESTLPAARSPELPAAPAKTAARARGGALRRDQTLTPGARKFGTVAPFVKTAKIDSAPTGGRVDLTPIAVFFAARVSLSGA
jgi:hypothetical protein